MKPLIKGISGEYVNLDHVFNIVPEFRHNTWTVIAYSVTTSEVSWSESCLFCGSEEEKDDWYKWFNKAYQMAHQNSILEYPDEPNIGLTEL